MWKKRSCCGRRVWGGRVSEQHLFGKESSLPTAFLPFETMSIVCRIALVSYVASMILFGVVNVGILFFAIGVLYALGAIMTVSLRSLYSQSVEHKRQVCVCGVLLVS